MRLLRSAHNHRSGTGAAYKGEARLKILACVVYAVAVVTTPSGQWRTLALYAPLVLAVVLLARLPMGKTLARSAAVIPFSLLIAAFVPFLSEGRAVATFHLLWARVEVTREGLLVLGEVVSKSWLCVVGLVILSSTTSPRELLAGLRKLGLPAVMVATLFLTLRYLTLFADEARQMERARKSRATTTWYRLGIRSTAGVVASLFIRGYDTGQRVHLAMLSRGFDGQVHESDTSSPSLSAVAACVCLGLLLVGIRVWGASW